MSDVEWERRDRQATAAAARLNYSLSLSLSLWYGRSNRYRARETTTRENNDCSPASASCVVCARSDPSAKDFYMCVLGYEQWFSFCGRRMESENF